MATYSWKGTTATWSTGSNWRTGGGDAGSPPGVGDDCVFDGSDGGSSSAACTLTGSTGVKSVNFTGYTGTFTHNASVNLTIGSAGQTGGACLFVSGMTYTLGNASSSAIIFGADGGTNTFTPGGRTFGNITVNGAGSTVSLAGALTCSTTATLTLTTGTFNANGQNVSVGLFSSSGSSTRTLTMGSGTWTLTNTATGTVWAIGGTTIPAGLTFTATTAPIVISGNSGTGNLTFQGAGQSYGAVSITGASARPFVLFQGTGNTYASMSVTAPACIQFNSAQTANITGALTINGSAGSYITILPTTHASAATIAPGSVSASYLAIKDMTFSGASLTATNSFDLGGNNTNGGSITAPTGGARVIGG